MSVRPGSYLGGIRTVQDIRLRCHITHCNCWHWKMALSHGKPNGSFLVDGVRRNLGVKRQAVIMSGRDIPEGHTVTSVPECELGQLCVNPRHSEVVPLSVIRRRVSLETRTKFRRNGMRLRGAVAKLTPEQVRQILDRRSEPRKHLAAEFGVCVASIYNILGGHCWRDVMGVPVNSIFSTR